MLFLATFKVPFLAMVKEHGNRALLCGLLCAMLCAAAAPFFLHEALMEHRVIWADTSRLVLWGLVAAGFAGFILVCVNHWEGIVSSRLLRVAAGLAGIASLWCSLASVYATQSNVIYIVLAVSLAGVFVVYGVAYLSVCLEEWSAAEQLILVAAGLGMYLASRGLYAVFADVSLLVLVPVLSAAVVLSLFGARFAKGQAADLIPDSNSSDGDSNPQPCPLVLSHDLADLMQHVGSQWGLTPRERDILPSLAHGHSIGRIAKAQSVSVNTIRTHVKGIYAKSGVHSQQELMTLLQNEEASLRD